MNERNSGEPEPEKNETEPINKTLKEIASELGFVETEKIQEVERQTIKASLILNTLFRSPKDEERFNNLIAQIQILGEPITEQENPKTGLSQIGLMAIRAATYFESGRLEDCKDEIYDIMIDLNNMVDRYPEISINLQKTEALYDAIKKELDRESKSQIKEKHDLNPEERRDLIAEKNLQELARRQEAGELEPYDYEVNYIWYLREMGKPVTRKDIQNHAIVIKPEEFEVLEFIEFINPSGEKVSIDFTDEDFDTTNPLIIFPEELGEENIEQEKQEPTSAELAKVCQEVLPEEECQEIASMELEDALKYSFSLLIKNGIKDPEGFLKEKGILQ